MDDRRKPGRRGVGCFSTTVDREAEGSAHAARRPDGLMHGEPTPMQRSRRCGECEAIRGTYSTRGCRRRSFSPTCGASWHCCCRFCWPRRPGYSSAGPKQRIATARRQVMTRITPDHLARGAFIYIRQSTSDQVLHNHESRRRQYGLVDRARALGWGAIEVIDDDLGRSGSGISRPGFEKLLAAICEGRVGAVVSIEASRLARNGCDWHTLLEFCGLVGTLILDEDGVSDPRHPNDRLLLGMKGTMSEMELSLFRQRSLEALKQKARRGELFLTVAVGYFKVHHDRIEKDPDRRVQEAIALVFTKFAELQTVRQVHLWMRHERLPLPAVGYGPEGRSITCSVGSRTGVALPLATTGSHEITWPRLPSWPSRT